MPATLGAVGALILLYVGAAWLEGVQLDVGELLLLACYGACFGLPAGALWLPSNEGRNRIWRVVATVLWYCGLVTAGMMSSVLAAGIAEILVRWKWL